jgi:hypothetical protein
MTKSFKTNTLNYKFQSDYDQLLKSPEMVHYIGCKRLIRIKNALKTLEPIVLIRGSFGSGKSLFLNSLIFEDIALPANETPNALPFICIQWGEREKLSIEYFTEEEQNRRITYLQKLVDGNRHPDVELAVLLLENLRQNPHRPKIKSEMQSIRCLTDMILNDSCWIKHINLSLSNEFLLNKQLVEIPSMYELFPEIYPDTDFLENAKLVIHVLGVEQDENALQLRRRESTLEHLLIQNKTDLNLDCNSYECPPDFSISSLQELINHQLKKGLPLSKELQEDALLLEKRTSKSYPENLLGLVKSEIDRLLKKSNNQSNLKHKTNIRQLLMQTLIQIGQEVESIENKISILNSHENSADLDLERLENAQSKLKGFFHSYLGIVDTEINDLIGPLSSSLQLCGDQIIEDVKKQIEFLENPALELPWILKFCLEKHQTQLNRTIHQFLKEICDALKTHTLNLKNQLNDVLDISDDFLNGICRPADHLVNQFLQYAGDCMEKEIPLSSIFKSNSVFFGTALGKTKSKKLDEVIAQLHSLINKNLELLAHEIEDETLKKLEPYLKELSIDIFKEFEQIKGDINYQKHNKSKASKKAMQLSFQINTLNRKAEAVQKLEKRLGL